MEVSVSLNITPETHSPEQVLNLVEMNFLKAIVSGIHSGFNEKKTRMSFDLGSPSNILRLKAALTERDIIFFENRKVYATDPVFVLWFRRRFL